MYKAEFKYWKSRRPPPDMSRALDFRDPTTTSLPEVCQAKLHPEYSGHDPDLGLRPLAEWTAWSLRSRPGLVVVPDVLTAAGQRRWARRCVADFTLPPARLNVDRDGLLQAGETWWDACRLRPSLTPRLRWATLGYHHDWDSKRYSEQRRSAFPADLARLSRALVGGATGVAMTAQAAIVNFYGRDATLSGHTDHSEANRTAPLLSLSIGQSAVLLLGGDHVEDVKEPPTALLLRSGDALVMSGRSRLCVHGVPRVVMSSTPTWRDDLTADPAGDWQGDEWRRLDAFLSVSRINLNVRQVLFDGQEQLEEEVEEIKQ